MIISTNHTSFTVSDMEQALLFYHGLLGMQVVSERTISGPFAETITGISGANMRIVYLQMAPNSEHRLELIQYLSPKAQPLEQSTSQPGCAHLALNVDDLDAMYRELSAKGVRFKSQPVTIVGGPNAGGKGVYLYGPDGVTLELLQPPG
ncbi:MAG: VOC family protein [Chloroflexi bacterium]|nr:VOC family protein [Chloroflexota bacterium]